MLPRGGAIVEPQVPMFYDMSSDPQEAFNLSSTVQTNFWIGLPSTAKSPSTRRA